MADDLVERAQARVGQVLAGKYTLERLIGVGGMAAVYAARHRNGARSAVKILHPAIAKDEGIRARFRNEGYAANKVEHPGAVRVLDDDVVADGDDSGTVYLVMELLEGESVHVRARRAGGTLPEDDVLAIAQDVLEVLEAAHARGIVHRDLKPDNLFLADEDGRRRVKVLDFGVARIADGAARTTAVGTTLGTPSYMAPEQARGQRDLVDGRSDLFALGATMFRLLANRRIHEGDAAAEVLGKVATIQAPPLRSVVPSASPAVAAIVDRALRFERDDRYPHARAMLDDVIAARSGAPLPSGGAPLHALAPPTFLGGSEPTGIVREGTVATVAARAASQGDATVADPLPPTFHPTSHPTSQPIPAIPSPALPPTLVAAELPATIDRGAGAPPPMVQAPPPAAPRAAPPRRGVLVAALSLAGICALGVLALVAMRASSDAPATPRPLEHEQAVVEEPEAAEGAAPADESEAEATPAGPASGAPAKIAAPAPTPVAKPAPKKPAAQPKKPTKPKKGKGK